MGKIVDISEAMLAAGLSTTATAEERGMVLMSITFAEGAVKRYLKYDPVYQQHTQYYPQMDMVRTFRESIWEISDTQAYERYISKASSSELQILHIPIRSITSLNIDYDGRAGTRSGSFGASTLKIEGTDFWPNYDSVDSGGNKICMDGIIRSQGLWPDNAGSVKVVYYAGYKPAELRGQDTVINASPIWDVALAEVVRRVMKMQAMKKKGMAGFTGPLTGETLGDYSYTADSALLMRMLGGNDLLPESQEKLSSFENYGLMAM